MTLPSKYLSKYRDIFEQLAINQARAEAAIAKHYLLPKDHALRHNVEPRRYLWDQKIGDFDLPRLEYLAAQAVYWETAYWELMCNKLYKPEAKRLEELNQKQAARIMELELLLSCLRRVGDGVHVDHQRLMSLYRFYEDKKVKP